MAAEEDAVKVCVRVRPSIQREQGDQASVHWKSENSTISQIDGTRAFHFDRVFNSLETTSQVHEEVAVPIIRSAIHGYNGTIFAYGQTSSGKTYTMMGTRDNPGIIPQAAKEVFRTIQEIPNREFLLRVSYMEIYNETVTDLLCDSRKKKPLEIREDINRNVYVADLTEEIVLCAEHVMQWIKKGEKNRHYGETKMNEHSSRSHTIFRMIVESRERNDPGNSENCEGAVMVSHLNLVDLAGSERASQTGAEGLRLKEGCNINRSLFILGQVIKKLSDDQPGAFINYRDSKLTRILQNSLGGNTKTVIICNITCVSFDETLSTLQFASAAKKVKNKPHVNEVLDDEALLKRYRKEIGDLKKQLEDLEASSASKVNAMANEEHAQLLAVIQQLQKEKEERISNLKNIVVEAALSQEISQEDQLLKRKRRVTWGAEKIQSTLYGSGVGPFDAGSKISAYFPKRSKTSDLHTISENDDDSVCTEFSDIDEATRVFEDFPSWENGSRITYREKATFHHSMIDLHDDGQFHSSALLKDSSPPKYKELAQKIENLENQLQGEVVRRESFEKETLKLKEQLEAKEKEKDELVKSHQLEITSLKDQLHNMPENNEVNIGLGADDDLDHLDPSNVSLSQVKMNNLPQNTQAEQMQENCMEENLSSPIHDLCKEQIQMLEQKIADLESNQKSDFAESLQICEAVILEKETALHELDILRKNFDSVVVDNESLKQEMAEMEKYLQEKKETNEFELLEKETQKEHEAQLIHEIGNLKKVIENAEMYNQELESELENKTKALKEQEIQMAEIKKKTEVLLKNARYADLSRSMGGDSEKLCEEMFQLKRSVSDAETVTRDSQREAAFLRSENLELKEKMDEISLRCQQREKDASAYEKQLESEKSNYRRMQVDLQKELQCAFNEINQLNGLMAGRVPKDLLSRVELEKKIADFSMQLTNALEEKSALEKENVSLSELKCLPSEIEQLKNQLQETSEELHRFQNEKEQSLSMLSDQTDKILEQKEQIERLTEEVANTVAIFQQYSELQILYDDLQTKCSLTDEEIEKKNLEAESLLKEINDLKQCVETLNGFLSNAQQETKELVQAQQEKSSEDGSMEAMLKSTVCEKDHLQEQVSNQQVETQSELFREKQDLEQKNLQLLSEMEQLQGRLNDLRSSPSIIQTEDKLQPLQEEITLLAHQRDELLCKVEEITAEKNILKQDLNDNIDMSIETQDELRITQEDLKHQKQLVSDLRKQVSNYADRLSEQAESYKNTPETGEANSETIADENKELEADNQSSSSDLEVLKEKMKSAELAVTIIEGEKQELLQKIHALEEQLQSVTNERDELENAKNNLLIAKHNLKEEVEQTAKQVCEVNEGLKCFSENPSHEDLTEQFLEHIQEREKLLETLTAVTNERDQLKLDLHDNIEMSIETQEELRNALDELKQKSCQLDALKSQVDASKGQTSNLEEDLEAKVLHLEEQLGTIVAERDQLSEEFRLLTEQKKNLEELLSSTNFVHEDIKTENKEVQVLTEMLVEEETKISTKLEEAESEQTLLNEKIHHLQQQIHIISEEKEHQQQLMDTLKSENLQLVSVQKQTEDGAVQRKDTADLSSMIEKLKEQLENTSQQLASKEKEAAQRLMELNNTNKRMIELEVLEGNLQECSILLEKIQGEKLELSSKLCALQEELETVTCNRDNLQGKLEAVLGENADLKEVLETALSSSSTTQEELERCQEMQQQENVGNGSKIQIPASESVHHTHTSTELLPFLDEKALGLQEQLQKTTCEYEQLLQMKNKLEDEKASLNCEVERLTNIVTEAQRDLESLQNENSQPQEHFLDLQQQLNAAFQDRDDLKIEQERLIAEMGQLKRCLKENDDMVHGLQEQLLQKVSEYEQLLQVKYGLEEHQNRLNSEVEILTNTMTEVQTSLEFLKQEKHQTEEQLLDLKQELNVAVKDRDDLNIAQERFIAEIDQLKEYLKEYDEKALHWKEVIQQGTDIQCEALQQTQYTLKNELDQTVSALKNTETQLEALRSEELSIKKEFLHLQHTIDMVTQERDDLKASQKILTLERDQLKETLEKNTEMIKTAEKQEEQFEVAAQTEPLVNNDLDQLLKDMESELATVQREKVDLEEKLFCLQNHVDELTKDKEELQVSLQSLKSERDQLKEDLRENIEMSSETQVDLRSTQEELQLQRERVCELTKEISSLEQKSSLLETELYETTNVLKEVTNEKANLDESKQQLSSEVQELLQQLKKQEVALCQTEKEKSEASQKVLELTSVVSNMAEEKDQLNCSKEDVEKQSVEMQNDIRRTREELQQQKEKVETLTDDISLLEEKLSSLQRELQENITLLNGAVEEKTMLDQAKQKLSFELEQLMDTLKSKDTMLELTESDKRSAAQEVLDLTKQVENMSQEREQLQLFKKNLEEEAAKLREDLKQLQHQHSEFREQETLKCGRLEELLSEVDQLKEKLALKDECAQELERDQSDLKRQVQKSELEMASLQQEQEQFQQLLQRARGEKETICRNLQDQETANEQLRESLTTCQTELELVKKERAENKGHLTEKVNEINAMIQQLSSLQEQLQQLHQELKDERIKNNDLHEKVSDLEKEIRVLRLMQSEPVQEEDELAERTECLKEKNQEFMDLMVTISNVYANQHSLLNNLLVDLHTEVEVHKQSLSAIMESVPSTHSRAFESLQCEYIKLNSQLQTLLSKFKVISANAFFKEQQYDLVNRYESDLCVLQKNNEELLLQCQNLEQNGTKWSESAAEELRFCELEFLNHLIFKKMDVIKCVQDGFSKVRVTLNSVEGDLKEELNYKKQFLSCLEEFKGLHFDAKKFSEGVVQENQRINGVVQRLTKTLKVILQTRIKQDARAYITHLHEALQEKKEKNKELLQKIQLLAPSSDPNILEEENARLCEKLKKLQAELKNMQCRIHQLENEVASAKADAEQKGEKASLLQEKLLSSVAEIELSEMKSKVSEKDKHLESAVKEMKALRGKLAQGAAPYQEEMESLKDQVVKLEMERMKLTKSTDQQIASLKSCVDYKDECMRKLREQLRRAQKDTDTTICSDKDGSSYPLTCGGGSGIVQSTAMLMLQSENTALKREISHYKKKSCHRSRNSSSREDEPKKLKESVETPSNFFSLLTETSSQRRSEVCRQVVVSPHKADIPPSTILSPGKTGMHRKRAISPSKAHLIKPQVMSPNKALRHSIPASSPGKTGLNRNLVSPFKAEGQLFSNLTESPGKKQKLPEPENSPKDKFLHWSKTLPYCPSKFFDNSTLGTLPDADTDLCSGITTETSEVNNWWDHADKNKNTNECKTS